MNKVYLKNIIDFLGKDVLNVSGEINDLFVKYLKPISEVDQYTLDWVNPVHKNKQEIAESSKAQIIIVDQEVIYSDLISKYNKTLIYVANPRLIIAKIANQFFISKLEPNIHHTAIIDSDAIIGNNVFIGPNTYIGKCHIGNNVSIFANASIYNNVTIDDNVIIQSGVVIGVDGMGCERDKNGTLVKFPHFGGVKINKNVEIGSNCQIARGVFSETIIGEGSKINGLCFIAHNCILGRNVWITGDTMLAGSVKIEDNVTIFSKVIIREQRNIGKGAIIGMGAVVTKDVPSNQTWIGNPAKRVKK